MNLGWILYSLGREEKNSKGSIKFILFLPFSENGYVMLADHMALDEDIFFSPLETSYLEIFIYSLLIQN